MASIGNTTAVNGVTTEIYDSGDAQYRTLILENLGAVKVWFTFTDSAADEQGFSIAATSTKTITLGQGKFPAVLNAWADGANADIVWQRLA